jgi:hypothetical protein
MMRLTRSDFLFWSGLHRAREQRIQVVLATPPGLLAHAGPQERARVDAMLGNILPVSLIISARDDRYGTFASAQYWRVRLQARSSSDSTKAGTPGSGTTTG